MVGGQRTTGQVLDMILDKGLYIGLEKAQIIDGLFAAATQATPVGEPVSTVLKFFGSPGAPEWGVAATVQTSILLKNAARTGRRSILQMPGRQGGLDVVELLGLVN